MRESIYLLSRLHDRGRGPAIECLLVLGGNELSVSFPDEVGWLSRAIINYIPVDIIRDLATSVTV